MVKRFTKGAFITFEGGEGSGKSTQAKLLADALRKRKFPVCATFEPGATATGEKIRKILLASKKNPPTPLTELLLYEIDRADHIRKVIAPALKAEKIVVGDRFTDSTMAYQGFGRCIPLPVIEKLNRIAASGIKPDLTFLMDLTPEKGLARLRAESGKRDRLESENLKFHRRVREGYRFIARRERRRVKVLNAMLPENKLHQMILDEVLEFVSQ